MNIMHTNGGGRGGGSTRNRAWCAVQPGVRVQGLAASQMQKANFPHLKGQLHELILKVWLLTVARLQTVTDESVFVDPKLLFYRIRLCPYLGARSGS
jgi:hypothetical protein